MSGALVLDFQYFPMANRGVAYDIVGADRTKCTLQPGCNTFTCEMHQLYSLHNNLKITDLSFFVTHLAIKKELFLGQTGKDNRLENRIQNIPQFLKESFLLVPPSVKVT